MLLFQAALPPTILEQLFTSDAPGAFPYIVVITGFNTDIEFDGVVYHVQTEDKGLDTPLILTLVYVGGAILASKRSPYNDLIKTGFDPLVLGERLQRQHTLICAAVKAGRIDDLKRLTQREPAEQTAAPKPAPIVAAKVPPKAPDAPPLPAVLKTKAPMIDDGADILALDDVPAEIVPARSEPRRAEQPEPVRLVGKQNDDFIQVEAEDALHLSLLEERDFHAGEVVTIRIRVSRGAGDKRSAAADVPVTVKILGTEFRPLILTTRSDRDGVATIHAWLPRFTKGRAAVLMRAAVDGFTAELRRVIHQP
ncbi:MAG TPA: hypothetical protein VER76_14460 [Pyrinomonadaceae bacterium]|nr:hypothetical protein [Pyrinomonadaceae bacterium]